MSSRRCSAFVARVAVSVMNWGTFGGPIGGTRTIALLILTFTSVANARPSSSTPAVPPFLRLAATTPSLGIAGDGGSFTRNAASVLASISRSQVRDLVLPGDNLYNPVGSYSRAWKPWSDAGMRFPIVAIGNHNGGYDAEIAFFRMPGESYAANWGPDVKFIVLNSDNKRTAADQLRFAARELQAAQEPLVFLVYHHPSLTISSEHEWQERGDFQIGMRRLLKQFRPKITAVLNGHDHFATLLHFDDLPIVVSGAVMGVRKPESTDNIQEGVRVKTAWIFDGQPYWVRLDTSQQTRARQTAQQALFHFVRAADDRVMCSVRVTTGRPAELAENCRGRRQ